MLSPVQKPVPAGGESLPPPGVTHQLTPSILMPDFREVWKNHCIFYLNLYIVLLQASGTALAKF